MGTDFSKPGVIIDEANLRLVDSKMGSPVPFSPAARGVFSSWEKPLDEVQMSPEQRKMIEESRRRNPPVSAHAVIRNLPNTRQERPQGEEVIVIPLPALKRFKAFLSGLLELKVVLTPEQAALFLEDLKTMPTPKCMADTKYIVQLIEQLERVAKTGTNP